MTELSDAEPAPSPGSPGPRALTAESMIKLATAVLGVLYVLGILVSNIQLIGLGIADFSGLQACNILTGFLFVCFIAGLVFILLPLELLTYFCRQRGCSSRRPLLNHACTTVICLVVAAVFAGFVGAIFQHLYPWSESYDSVFRSQEAIFTRQAWANSMTQLGVAYNQVTGMYGHLKILLASGLIIIIANLLYVLRSFREEVPAAMIYNVMGSLAFSSVALCCLLLFGYADDVYPNLLYNLGGGQPQIAELSLTESDSVLADWLGARARSGDSKSGLAFKTAALAVWYQSDKFLYVSPLAEGTTAQVFAIDMKLVHGMRYLADASVRMSSGGRIEKVHSVDRH